MDMSVEGEEMEVSRQVSQRQRPHQVSKIEAKCLKAMFNGIRLMIIELGK